MSDQPRPIRSVGFASIAIWLLFAVIGLTALALVFVHAPGRIKLIGLYGLAYGLIAGWGLGLLAAKLHLPGGVRTTILTFVLIAAGSVGIALESHRVWAAGEWEAFEKSPTGRLANEVLAKPDSPADLRASLQESLDNQRSATSVANYLARRVSALGELHSPWPLVLWLAEVAIAAGAGTWVFRKQALALYAAGTSDKAGIGSSRVGQA